MKAGGSQLLLFLQVMLKTRYSFIAIKCGRFYIRLALVYLNKFFCFVLKLVVLLCSGNLAW